MKHGILSVVFGALALTAASAASARVNISVDINPFGYGGYAPPVVYQPDPYYYAPPVVYLGAGSWGGDGHRHWRGHRGGSRHR
jgi:hypothetical protein